MEAFTYILDEPGEIRGGGEREGNEMKCCGE
jgi:hypothetical protein